MSSISDTASINATSNTSTKASAEKSRAWAYLMIASVFEIIFALSTNASVGFTVLIPSIATVVAAGFGIFFLSTALRHLDVGVGYTVWVGIGSIGTVVFGTILFNESISVAKVACFALIIGGIVGLKLADSRFLKA
jgi:quaternary ammonium compound-resistance protein SugE